MCCVLLYGVPPQEISRLASQLGETPARLSCSALPLCPYAAFLLSRSVTRALNLKGRVVVRGSKEDEPDDAAVKYAEKVGTGLAIVALRLLLASCPARCRASLVRPHTHAQGWLLNQSESARLKHRLKRMLLVAAGEAGQARRCAETSRVWLRPRESKHSETIRPRRGACPRGQLPRACIALCTRTAMMQARSRLAFGSRLAFDSPRHPIVQIVVEKADPVTNLVVAAKLLDPPDWFQEGDRGKKVRQS